MSEYLQLENRLLKLELRVMELEKQLAQPGAGNGVAPSAPSPAAPNIVPPSTSLPSGVNPPSDEEIRNYQKVRSFMDLLGACR